MAEWWTDETEREAISEMLNSKQRKMQRLRNEKRGTCFSPSPQRLEREKSPPRN